VQVIVNYLSNGIKYSNGKTDVTIQVKREDEHIIVAVKDEGLGISKENLPYIFEKFFRAEKTKGMEGIGLGLYLCRQIINAHSGMVWAESEEGKGSVFFFSIPVKFYSKP
jgi:two-component system sensor histidine kinase VicK